MRTIEYILLNIDGLGFSFSKFFYFFSRERNDSSNPIMFCHTAGDVRENHSDAGNAPLPHLLSQLTEHIVDCLWRPLGAAGVKVEKGEARLQLTALCPEVISETSCAWVEKKVQF